MKFILGLFLASALVGSAWGQAPSVVFPSTPAPPPAPIGQATQLQSDQLYVVQSTNPIVIVASPQGVVKITPDAGPLKIRGKFVDGTATETRTFKGPHIYIVEASGSGTCELIVAPTMDQKDVIRRTLTTDITPAPGPTPVPSDPLVQSLVNAIKADGQGKDVAQSLATVYRSVAKRIGDSKDTVFGSVASYAELFKVVKPIQDGMVPFDSIPNLRKVVGDMFAGGLGSTAASPVDRVLAAKVFNDIAAKLEAVK